MNFSVKDVGALSANNHEINAMQIPQIKHTTLRIATVKLNPLLIFAILCYLITCIYVNRCNLTRVFQYFFFVPHKKNGSWGFSAKFMKFFKNTISIRLNLQP